MERNKKGRMEKGGQDGSGGQRSNRRDRRKQAELVDHNLMKALAKPIRARVLAVLAERVASPSEIAVQLDEDLSMVSYHVRILFECGVIELDHQEQRRGAIEHFYRCPDRVLLPAEVWDGLPDKLRANVSVRIVQEFLDDARESMSAGVFDDPAGELSWTPLVLDEQGMKELGSLAEGFLESLLEIQEKAAGRLPDQKSGLTATAFLACFRSTRSAEDGKRAFATKRR